MAAAQSSAMAQQGSSTNNSNSIYVTHLLQEVRKMQPSNPPEVRTKACAEIAHILYHGGILEPYLLAHPRIFVNLITLIPNRREPLSLRMQAIQTLSIACRSSDSIQQYICLRGAAELLMQLLDDDYEEMRKWAAHCLLFLMIKNGRKYESQLKSQAIQNALKRVEKDDWCHWTFNEATELLLLVQSI
ncbi:hypothetical protein DFJ73DRAFT_845205 [Zopfochytrium polystomum]|nr:hypothetical protein DFJ73DRAFT_845205 [Zopfochytrium polystomum]